MICKNSVCKKEFAYNISGSSKGFCPRCNKRRLRYGFLEGYSNIPNSSDSGRIDLTVVNWGLKEGHSFIGLCFHRCLDPMRLKSFCEEEGVDYKDCLVKRRLLIEYDES